jgi:hypothetical protein
MNNCYRVKVRTTNALGDTAMASPKLEGTYITCRDGVIYVHGTCFADVEDVVHKDWIISIECLGPSYVA